MSSLNVHSRDYNLFIYEFYKFIQAKGLGENICSLVLSWAIFQFNFSIFYKLLDEMTMHINMFGPLMEGEILCQL
jgi:hypothetical protein